MCIIFLALQMCICFVSTYVCLPTRTCQRIFTQHFTKLEISDHQYQQHFVLYSNADLGDKSPLSELIFILDDAVIFLYPALDNLTIFSPSKN